jgi:Cu+-exporting ATPase
MSEHHCCHHHEHGEAKVPTFQDPDAWYICPMCPGVRQKGFGTCPSCGMALEPENPLLDEGPNPELVDFQKRFWIGLIFTLPVFVLEMGAHVFGLKLPFSAGVSQWVQLVLSAPVVLWAGYPVLERGVNSIRQRSLNMFTLIALGVAVAFGYSLVAVLLPGLFPPEFKNEHGLVAVYFEAASVITVLVLLGQVMELRARARTTGALKALLDLAPKTALRLTNGEEEEIALDDVQSGDELRVKPGGRVPVDGVILSGHGDVDESMVTGESMPVSKAAGDHAIGGTVNQNGAFVLRAEAVGADSLLSRIAMQVAQAQRSRAPIQRLADNVAGYFVPAVVAVSLLAFLAWWLYGPEPSLTYGLVAAVSVLIIACPCALGLATPMSIMVGVGRAAGAGVLVRDAEAMEAMNKIDTLIVDKTGTLTEGRPALVSIKDIKEQPQVLLPLVLALEEQSEHPIAHAIVSYAKDQGVKAAKAESFKAHIGGGLEGRVEGHDILIGARAFMEKHDIAVSDLDAEAKQAGSKGQTPVFVAVDGALRALLALGDPIKETTPAALKDLREAGVEIIMATGDAQETAQAVAKELGIERVHAAVLPEDKANLVKELQAQGRMVAVAGDGVNDAPALAQAHVGIAMGTGTDIAMESGALTLVKGDLAALGRARKVSHAVVRNIRQNLFFAFLYNALGVPVAAGVLYPVFGLLLSPMIAAAAMSMSSLSVIANALRLRRVKL